MRLYRLQSYADLVPRGQEMQRAHHLAVQGKLHLDQTSCTHTTSVLQALCDECLALTIIILIVISQIQSV